MQLRPPLLHTYAIFVRTAVTLRRAKEGARLGKLVEGHVLEKNQSHGEKELTESDFVP